MSKSLYERGCEDTERAAAPIFTAMLSALRYIAEGGDFPVSAAKEALDNVDKMFKELD